MATQITNYQCPACTGPLHFVGQSGKLECDFCGGSYEVSEIEALYAQKEKQAQEAMAQADEKARAEAEKAQQWDTEDMTAQWEDGDKMRTYSCPSCSAELICDETTAATSCPYCGNPTVIPGQFTGALRPDYVIPFKINQEAAKDILKQHYKGKIFLPKEFARENKINEIKGVYVPFWMFDGLADADVFLQGQRSTTTRQGDYRVTNTRHYAVRRSGTVEYKKIPVDASSRMPDEYMDAIEPFNYQELTKFSTAYLPGYLADKYDVEQKDVAQRAETRMVNSAISAMRADVTGYDTLVTSQHNVKLHRGKVHYAMLPVYLLNTKWKDTNYLFALNGQTGKMVSKLPMSWSRFWSCFFGIFLSITGVLGTILYVLQ